ncbi:hypothetical protein [Parapedobacter koreensis]|uniref:Uncharacterized protein n=1 Tax=Parapedobacter koreensis TaxID=332977 RepID=A0A1H7T9Z4_9SPHI|nr:hypothetical protein [Parapedobacter koreensis]SEL81204.1 hypothetical protein SAMN05421740_110156 [Parapedobacter koreensis]
MLLRNDSSIPLNVEIVANAYDYGKLDPIPLAPEDEQQKYGFSYRFAGRVETGEHGISDPAMATEL